MLPLSKVAAGTESEQTAGARRIKSSTENVSLSLSADDAAPEGWEGVLDALDWREWDA